MLENDTLRDPEPAPPEVDADSARIQEALLPLLGSRYELISRLGAGAFGEVYRARDTMLDRDVAIKRVRLDTFADDEQREEVRERTIREAKTSAKLKHPNIVTIHDIASTPDTNFIIMEFVDGPTLEHVLRERVRLVHSEILDILGATAKAIDYAHENGIVHRDIKPANVMLEGTSDVKVMDFGIAKIEAATGLTVAGCILGSPHYMSPEQARGDGSVDRRSDLFSLGCVLYECVTGEKPFKGKTVMATLMSIIGQDPDGVDCEALGFHRKMEGILQRALAKEPAMRFGSAVELMDAIRDLPEPEAPTSRPVVVADASVPQRVVTRREPGSTSAFDITLQGGLEDVTVAEAIREVYAARHTGILHLSREKIEKRIYFRKGNIVFANSDVHTDRLGEFLVGVGELERQGLERAALAARDTGQRLGGVLVEMDLLAADKLDDAVRRQVGAIIHSVIEWEKGAYGFEMLDRPVEEDIELDLSTAELILSGIRGMRSVDSALRAIGDGDRVPVTARNPLLLYQKMALTTAEAYVWSRIDGMATVGEISAVSPLGDDDTMRCVYALVATGVVALESKRARSQLGTTAVPDVEIPKPDFTDDASNTLSCRDDGAELLEEIAEKHDSLRRASFYDLLEVDRGASSEFIASAYFMLARRYHPDRHHLDALKTAHGLLEELFSHLNHAYQVLVDPKARRKYDEELDSKRDEGTRQEVEAGAPAIPAEVTARRQYQQGRKHFDQMDYFAAVQCLEESVRLEPENAQYHKLLAAALGKNPKWRKDAVLHLLVALRDDERDLPALLALAQIYESSSLPSEAEKIYERVLGLDPRNVIAIGKLLPADGVDAGHPESKTLADAS